MPQDMVPDAREQADRSAPAVKAAALLHLARVLTKVDSAEAEHVLDEGLALTATLPEGERDILIGEAAALAATVSPRRAFPLALEAYTDRESVLRRALFNMLEHGHVQEAVAYLSEPAPGEPYPFEAALQAMGRGSDEETRLRVFRGAIRALRQQRSSDRPEPFRPWHHFMRLFTYHWRRLPADEARTVVRDLVGWIQSEPDSRTNASFGSGSHTVRFSSTHEQLLFQILGPLRHLDPDRAASIAGRHPQLSAAAGEFPYGQESMNAAARAEQPAIPREPVEQPHYIDVGRRLIPIPEAIRTEFKDAFAAAFHEYAADTDPEHFNDAPQICWPSAFEFRKILYHAGRHEGRAATRYLDRIPDPALRLFAQIECAAALAGLPPLGGRTIRPGPRGLREMVRVSRGGDIPLSAAAPAMPVTPPVRRPNLQPSRDLRISPATVPPDEGASGGSGSDFVEVRNATLKAVVSTLHEVSQARIEWPSSLDPNARYDFVLVLPRPESRETMIRLMREGIAKHFDLSISWEIRTKESDVLTAPAGIRARRAPEPSNFEFGSIGIGAARTGAFDIGAGAHRRPMEGRHPAVSEGLIVREILSLPMAFADADQADEDIEQVLRRFRRQLMAPLGASAWIGGIEASLSIAELCETIEGGLDRPLVDETNLAGAYAISVHTEAATTADFLRAACERLGLVLTPGPRAVRTLIVRARRSG
jgi:uncharacterized protein (TIGR03435 family)